jgi:hypothetical protein
MSRSHVLLHCNSVRLAEAHKGPRNAANQAAFGFSSRTRDGRPALELSKVGRIVDEGEHRAARLDGWVIWEAEERVAKWPHNFPCGTKIIPDATRVV